VKNVFSTDWRDTLLVKNLERKRGRLGDIWRKTMEKEPAEMGLISRAAAVAVAKNRYKWRQVISGLMPNQGEGTKLKFKTN